MQSRTMQSANEFLCAGESAMEEGDVSRREFLQSATAASLIPGAAANGAALPLRRPLSISSANGLKALAKTMDLLSTGSDALDAAVEGVAMVEEDPNDM